MFKKFYFALYFPVSSDYTRLRVWALQTLRLEIEMSAEACRNQASRFSFQAYYLPTRYDFEEGDITIGQTKRANIS